MITESYLNNVHIGGYGLVDWIDWCLTIVPSLCLFKSVSLGVFNISAFFCGVFLLCGIDNGVTESNGFAFLLY